MLDKEATRRLEQAQVRIDRIFWLPAIAACHVPPDDFASAINDEMNDTDAAVTQLSTLRDLRKLRDEEGLSDDEATDELVTMIARSAVPGFLYRAVTPVTFNHKAGGCMMSWGHTHVEWCYAASLQQMVEQCEAWAAERNAEDTSRGKATATSQL